jgi:hypothetical protein
VQAVSTLWLQPGTRRNRPPSRSDADLLVL